MTADQRELILSFLMGPEWAWHTYHPYDPAEAVCSACGRSGSCASDCAPILTAPPR